MWAILFLNFTFKYLKKKRCFYMKFPKFRILSFFVFHPYSPTPTSSSISPNETLKNIPQPAPHPPLPTSKKILFNF
jgi:hypothetical protein